MQREKAHKIREKSAGKLEHANVQAYLMTRREINVGEELDIRLDLVNIAKNPAFLGQD